MKAFMQAVVLKLSCLTPSFKSALRFFLPKKLSRLLIGAFFILSAAQVFAGDPRVISVSVNPASPMFGDRITVTMVYCAAAFQQPMLGLAVSQVPVPSDARISGLGQVFIVSRAGYNFPTSVPAAVPGGNIGYGMVTPTAGLNNCSTCGQTSPDGQLITVVMGDVNPLMVPGPEYFPGCNPTNLYVHAVMKNNYLADGDYNNVNLCPQSFTWTIPTLAPYVEIHKSVEGTLQLANDLVLFSIDYDYASGAPVVTDAIPNLPGAGTSWTLVSTGPAGFYSGPAPGPVTPGQMMTWTLPNRGGPPPLKGSSQGTVWFLLRLNGTPAPGTRVNNTANVTMGSLSDSSSTSLVAGQPAISIRKSQSINNAFPGDIVTYYLEYGINGSQLVAYQPFDEMPLGTYGNPAGLSGTPPPGWQFLPNKSNGSWTIEDPCGTGDRVIRGDTTQNDDYPGLLYSGYPMTNTAQCLGTILAEVKIDPVGSVQGNGYEGADALVVIRNDANGTNSRAYGLVLSVDDYIGNNTGGNIGFQKCIGSNCTWPLSVNSFQISGNKWYHVKIQTGPTSCDFSSKVWAKGDPEPGGWMISWSDPACVTDSMDCATSGRTWYSGVAEQGGANASTQDSYNNFIMLKPRVAANTTLYDTIPASITFLGEDGLKPMTISPGNMVGWNLGNIYDEGGTYTWWGRVDGCEPATNVAAIDGNDPILPIISNETILDIYCGTPTVTPTVTQTNTFTFTRTFTPTFTATPTSTYTATRTNTPTSTPTFTMTPTPTDTPTRTPTPTFTDTRTYTPTRTATPTFTDTNTPSATPTATPSRTATPTFTDTNTPSATPTDTPTRTPTPTSTPTKTITPSFTATDTISSNTPTDTPTFTATPTITPTFTATPTYTNTLTATPTFTMTNTFSSNTPTATPTFTSTPTFTPTFTATPTFTVTKTCTPTFTNTPVNTPTFTPTFTRTSTATPTFTQTYTATATYTATPTFTYTFTVTCTPTITPTLRPYPYMIRISVLNEAGEIVKHISTAPSSNMMTVVDFDISGDISSNVMARDSVLNIFFQGVETPWTVGQGYTAFTWDGTNDSGQRAASGPYFIQIEQLDSYDHVITLTKDVTVIRNEQYVELKIFNSAGEIVRQIRDYEKAASGNVVLRAPDMIVIDKDNDTLVTIAYGWDPLEKMEWDSKNSDGVVVASGVYELMVTVKTDTGRVVTAAKSIMILKEGNTYLKSLSAVPNPYNGIGDGVEIRWEFEGGVAKQGYANVLILNMAGERVRTISGRLETGKAMWDLNNSGGALCSAGVYIAVVEARGDDGHTQNMKIKLAVSMYKGR